MDTTLFKEKFEGAVDAAKKNKANGTQVTVRIILANGETYRFTQTGGSWFKYSVDEEKGILTLGDRAVIDGNDNDRQIKTVNYIDINYIIAFNTEYITETPKASNE